MPRCSQRPRRAQSAPPSERSLPWTRSPLAPLTRARPPVLGLQLTKLPRTLTAPQPLVGPEAQWLGGRCRSRSRRRKGARTPVLRLTRHPMAAKQLAVLRVPPTRQRPTSRRRRTTLQAAARAKRTASRPRATSCSARARRRRRWRSTRRPSPSRRCGRPWPRSVPPTTPTGPPACCSWSGSRRRSPPATTASTSTPPTSRRCCAA